jgi:cobyric acid synthase
VGLPPVARLRGRPGPGRAALARGAAAFRVAVVRLPRISNFTDVDALGLEPDLDVVFASGSRDLAYADLIVLPGTRSTISDLAWLRSRGLDRVISAHARRGRPLLGICGGFQMLGAVIADPHGIETDAGAEVEGLGLLDVRTDFAAGKTLRLPSGTAQGVPTVGYEIHHGRVTVTGGAGEFLGGARADPDRPQGRKSHRVEVLPTWLLAVGFQPLDQRRSTRAPSAAVTSARRERTPAAWARTSRPFRSTVA